MKRILSLLLASAMLVTFVGCTDDKNGDVSSAAVTSSQGDVVTSSTGEAPVSDPDELTYDYSAFINGNDAKIKLSAPDQCLYNYNRLKENEPALTEFYDALAYEATHFTNPSPDSDKVCSVYFSKDISRDDLTHVYEYFFFDHPELWYLVQPDKTGCTQDAANPRIAYLNFSDTLSDIPSLNVQIENAADKLLAGAARLTSDIDREAYLSGYMYDHYTIDWDKYNKDLHSSPKEVLLGMTGVCVGYALTTVYLLQRMNIFAVVGHGNVSTGMVHCWAIVKKDGKFVYIDNYDMRDKGEGVERSIASYFCFDDIEVYSRDHTTIALGVILPGSPVDDVQVVTENTYPKEEETSSDTTSDTTSTAA